MAKTKKDEKTLKKVYPIKQITRTKDASIELDKIHKKTKPIKDMQPKKVEENVDYVINTTPRNLTEDVNESVEKIKPLNVKSANDGSVSIFEGNSGDVVIGKNCEKIIAIGQNSKDGLAIGEGNSGYIAIGGSSSALSVGYNCFGEVHVGNMAVGEVNVGKQAKNYINIGEAAQSTVYLGYQASGNIIIGRDATGDLDLNWRKATQKNYIELAYTRNGEPAFFINDVFQITLEDLIKKVIALP